MAVSNDEFNAKTALASSLEALCDDVNCPFSAKAVIGEVNPGLEIDGIGRIGMPISDHDAKRMISISRQTPSGVGSDIVVDDTFVRRTWEIHASRVKTRHPKWDHQQRKIVNEITKQLGIRGGAEVVEAQLYKLVVYEPEAMFERHTEYAIVERGYFDMLIDFVGRRMLEAFLARLPSACHADTLEATLKSASTARRRLCPLT